MSADQQVWHPVEFSLPPYGTRVLVTYMYGINETTRQVKEMIREKTDSEGEWWHNGRSTALSRAERYCDASRTPSDPFGVLAWMPLPEPYRG